MTTINLTQYDIILCLDKSGSMSTKDCPGGKSRWDYAKEATEALARKAEESDKDGLTIIPFSNSFTVYDGVTSDKVHQVFQENEPNGGTDTAKVLKHVLDGYISKKPNVKPIIVLCITDGEPNDKAKLAEVITDAANKIDADEEIGIQFIQVGQDSQATAFLKSLDDDLTSHGAKFDIVDTMTIDEMENKSLVAVLIEAITD